MQEQNFLVNKVKFKQDKIPRNIGEMRERNKSIIYFPLLMVEDITNPLYIYPSTSITNPRFCCGEILFNVKESDKTYQSRITVDSSDNDYI